VVLIVSKIKTKQIKRFASLPKKYAMKTYGRVEVELHTFLTSILDGSG
jgi:hypothetical protein